MNNQEVKAIAALPLPLLLKGEGKNDNTTIERD